MNTQQKVKSKISCGKYGKCREKIHVRLLIYVLYSIMTDLPKQVEWQLTICKDTI